MMVLGLQLQSCSMSENLDKINRNFVKCLFISYMQGGGSVWGRLAQKVERSLDVPIVLLKSVTEA